MLKLKELTHCKYLPELPWQRAKNLFLRRNHCNQMKHQFGKNTGLKSPQNLCPTDPALSQTVAYIL